MFPNPPGTDDVITWPGASRLRKGALFENEETASTVPLSIVDPTLTAVEIQPGAERLVELPLFPDEITVAIPTDRRVSIAAFLVTFAESHCA